MQMMGRLHDVVIKRDTDDILHQRAHHNVTVMSVSCIFINVILSSVM